ncbi:Zinc finger C2H2-type,Zinc finger, RING/FYVE/PHD-type [Cinara cedri]|uniref:Zinc finger C2H2-type,Zinc finger, RING/FYVE/PHD-type n=1 Tax=Cinara cedri TaxID=506608 RepID=A0A5E4MR77_9HEMI|nr:Zinc finger C2H2-type,Zinc finger, RING/FYVE/PHD-type [Cinara cedri]
MQWYTFGDKKTDDQCDSRDDTQRKIQKTNNNAYYVLSDPPPTDSQQKTVYATQNKTILLKTLSALKIPNPNVFFITDPLHYPIPLKMNISPNNSSVQKVNTGNKSTMKPIQPKITNDMKMINTAQTQSNLFLSPSKNNSLNPKLLIIKLKKPPKKTKSIVPNILPEKPVVKLIKPNTMNIKHVFRHNIKAPKNKLANNYENGVCTIKLSSSLFKGIQNEEKLFMCTECDKIYTEYKDLLDHQIIHNKFDEKKIKSETQIRKNPSENSLDTNLIKCTTIESEKMINNDNNEINKQTKPTTKTTINPKMQKIVFKDDCAHELVAHNAINYVYNCEQCCQGFLYKDELETHTKTHHNENKKYLCPYCDASFPYSNGLKNHLVKHIDLNGSKNPTTEIVTNQIKLSSIRHIKSEKFDQLFTDLENIPDDCDEVYFEQDVDDKYQVRIATNDVKSASLPLDSLVDEDIELNNVLLEDDKKTNTNQQQITAVSKKRVSYTICRLCLMIVSYSRIGKHMKKKHNNAAPYQCNLCHAEFNRKYTMDDHQRKHTNIKPHKCIECSKCFNYKHHLSRHMMTVHKSDSLEKLFKCPVCDKAFLFKEYLTLHTNSQHKGKHYMCQICGKTFSTNSLLNKHQLCHTDERPYMCEHCGRTFKCKNHCDTHTKNMHPGYPQHALPPEKFECNLCNKKFSTKIYRDMHFKRHNGQGHNCDICFKLFVSKAHMQRHIKILHPN